MQMKKRNALLTDRWLLHGVFCILLASVLLSIFTACDAIEKPDLESETNVEVTTLTQTENEPEEEEPEYQEPLDYAPHEYSKRSTRNLKLSTVFEAIGVEERHYFYFIDLYDHEHGREKIADDYNQFLNDMEANPGCTDLFSAWVNVYSTLMHEHGNNRRNIKWEFESDAKGMKHELVSTADDFALISYKSTTQTVYVTGFVNGKLYDGLQLMGSEEYNKLIAIINENGYRKTMNNVRDEFWGRMWEFKKSESVGDVTLLVNSSIEHTEDRNLLNSVYTQFQIQIWSNALESTIERIEPIYGISDSYISERWGNNCLSDAFNGGIKNRQGG